MKKQLNFNYLQNRNLNLFIWMMFLFALNGNSQVFTKITEGPLVNEQADSYFASWGDYDSDGDLDLYQSLWVASPSHPQGYSLLYENNCDGTFSLVKKIPNELLSTNTAGGNYSVWLDIDQNGTLDLFVKAPQTKIYLNKGDGSFNPTQNQITNLPNYNTTITGGWYNVGSGEASWLDYDNDGLLDFYAGRKELYHNNGNGDFDPVLVSPFSEMTEYLRGDAITTVDYNNDGLMDLYIVSPISNTLFLPYMQLYKNIGGGNFEIVDNSGLTDFRGWVYGACWGDIDNDGDLDVYIPGGNYLNGGWDKLMKNNGDGTFSEIFLSTGVYGAQAGGAFADYDNDGDLDLYIPGGSTNRLFDNDGTGNFTQNTSEIVTNDIVAESFGACWADTDNDGDLDLFVPTGGGNKNDRFYQNNTSGKNWLKVHCKGIQSNSDAIGARVYVKATINGQSVWQMREISANSTRGGESGAAAGHVVHIGLGDASIIETLKIVWPASGITQEFQNVAPNRFLEIVENVNSISEMAACTPDLPIENPGFVAGKLFIDNNNNCTFEVGIDAPIANKAVRAEPGTYFTYTDNEGNYEMELPAGSYTITENPSDDAYQVASCQTEFNYEVDVIASERRDGRNGAFDKRLIPCNGTIDIDIASVPIDPTDCNGTLQTEPCPGHLYQYCVTVTNNSDLPTNPNSELGFVITDQNFVQSNFVSIVSIEDHCSNTFITGNGDSGMEIPILDPIPPGGICTYCVTIDIDPAATGAFNIVYDFNNAQHNTEDNLIVNGDFAAGDNGFYFDPVYTFTGVPGNSHVFVDDQAYNTWQHDGTGIGGTDFLRVDGALIPGNFWCQDVLVEQNSSYNFSAFFNNLIIPALSGTQDPNIQVTINGNLLFQTGDIPEDPDAWIPFQDQWCSETNTTAIICMSVVSNLQNGGNDFGVDDISFIPWVGAADVFEDFFECSCDPNDKRVSPQGCGENGNVAKDQELTYHIRFENTGFGTAHNILLKDQLDADLDLNTLQIITASHPITDVQIIPDNNLIIKFDNINLPSALVDSLGGAKGYVVFKISPKSGLADGTEITNQCGIYFDRNEVVLTEVTKNTLYDKPTPEAAFTYKHSCSSTGLVYDFTYTGGTADNATYFWEFEDGVVATSTAQNPTGIVFANANGYKLVTLTVTRNGCSETVFDTIQVASALSSNGKKVTICHNGQTIQVDKNSLANHLAHGDCVGACAESFNNKSMESAVAVTESVFSVSLAPNPSNESCKISVRGLKEQGKMTVEVYNYTGQLQKTFTSDQSEVNLSTKEFTNGIYFIKVTSDENSQVGKLLIQH